jgi:murein L,D-transpeptidase YafK
MRRTIFITFLAGLIFFAASSWRQVAKSSRLNPDNQPRRSSSETQPDRKPLELPFENPRIMVHKAARKLELYSGEALLRTYRIGLGFSPVADKRQEGDGATPEGDFYVFVKNSRSAYYLSLGVSYPNVEDGERGLRDGLINRAQYNAIVRAVKNKTAPPQYTRLGGLIYIHGHGARSDWTWGCVALENEDIKELFDAVGVGTQVTILP